MLHCRTIIVCGCILASHLAYHSASHLWLHSTLPVAAVTCLQRWQPALLLSPLLVLLLLLLCCLPAVATSDVPAAVVCDQPVESRGRGVG
jgi:hypothetical protein